MRAERELLSRDTGCSPRNGCQDGTFHRGRLKIQREREFRLQQRTNRIQEGEGEGEARERDALVINFARAIASSPPVEGRSTRIYSEIKWIPPLLISPLILTTDIPA